ncbi:hypothetical protein CCR75_001869 [Bremia lactucae]|uniref:Uncharacterized protein n=1 Tax=Bremia lactucae TaxID=4779 RepID=A0A976FIS7_BRELC|nr:hypothetical protein CCR75_001869 [Bremia lactucae]
MILGRYAASALVLVSTAKHVQVEANKCKASDSFFSFLVDDLPTNHGFNTCVANNAGTIAKALAKTLFSGCNPSDVYDLVKNEDLRNFYRLFRSIAQTPAAISKLVYKHMAAQTDESVDSLCDAFGGTLGPCAGHVIPKLLPALLKDEHCCAEISDFIELLNLVVPPDRSMESFLVNEVIDGINSFLCSNKGEDSCGLNMFKQFTTKYTVENFDFFQHVLFPFITIEKNQECAGWSGKSYTDTASRASARTINFGCCINQMRPLLQTLQRTVKYVVGDEVWDIVSGMVSLKDPKGAFVDSLSQTTSCEFHGKTCSDPHGMSDDITITRDLNRKHPGKNGLIDTDCEKTDKCSQDKSVCSKVCKRGSVVVPNWLQSTLAYQRNLANKKPFCFAQIPATHNSAITLADGFGNRDQLFNQDVSPNKTWSFLKTNNQVLSLTDQLILGVRFLEINTHFFLNKLRTGQCGSLNSTFFTKLSDALGESLGKYGTFIWGPELLGCFPSISGIKSSEQPLTKDSLTEIKAWIEANPDEFVVVYLNTGADITRSKQIGAVDTLLKNTFGDLLVPTKMIDNLASDDWAHGSINEFLKAGHQILALANTKTQAAYNMHDMCHTEKYLAVDFINDLPDANHQINNIALYNTSNWIRTWSEQIRYLSLSSSWIYTRKQSVFLEPSNIPNYLRWNVNIIALDSVDVAKMAAQVWTWAENEPSTTASNAYVSMNKEGRWIARTNSTKAKLFYRACWASAKIAWLIIPVNKRCPRGTAFEAPMDPYQNYLLRRALSAKNIEEISVVINAKMPNMPPEVSAVLSTVKATPDLAKVREKPMA